jgi:hypothetical protein
VPAQHNILVPKDKVIYYNDNKLFIKAAKKLTLSHERQKSNTDNNGRVGAWQN